jgi:urate oxidase
MAHALSSRFGEARLRLLRVLRRGDRHDPKHVTLALRFQGDVLIPPEPLKALIYRVAAEQTHDEVEALGLAICERVFAEYPEIGLARVEVAEDSWGRVVAGGRPQAQTFTPGGGERRVAIVTTNGTRTAVTAGIDDLVLLRTGGLMPRGAGDAEEPDVDALPRLVIGAITARWVYTSAEIEFAPYRQGVRSAILDTFACHAAQSVHHLLTATADVVLGSYQEVASVTLTMNERAYRPVDDFAVDGDALFIAQDEPLAVTEVTVERP